MNFLYSLSSSLHELLLEVVGEIVNGELILNEFRTVLGDDAVELVAIGLPGLIPDAVSTILHGCCRPCICRA